MKKHHLIKNLLVIIGAFAICGCSVMKYSGADYNPENELGITTQELAYFKTYKKNVEEKVAIRLGITKTQNFDTTAMYVGVINDSEYPYTLSSEDFSITEATGRSVRKVTAKDFLATYYEEQNQLLMSSQAISPSIKNFANIMNNYQGQNQVNALKNDNNTEATISHIEETISQIKAHTLGNGATVNGGESKYFYVYFEDTDEYPITIKFKETEWTFGAKPKSAE